MLYFSPQAKHEPFCDEFDHGTVGPVPTHFKKSQAFIADHLFFRTYRVSNPRLEEELLIGLIAGASDGNGHVYGAGKKGSKSVAAGQDPEGVSVEALPTGIYLLKVQTPKGIHAEKILID